MSPDEIKAAELVIASGGRLSLVEAGEFLKQEKEMNQKTAGCTGDCANQAPCICSHATTPRIPRRPYQAPVQFCGHAKRVSLWVRVWRYLTGPRAF
jgi:hypothetical protein